jgi:hypothetical protein
MSSPHTTGSPLRWRKTKRSSSTGNDCVEVANLEPGTAVRDSKDPSGPKLSFSAAEWAAFAGRVRAGALDL